jgi:hypothetical protein
MIDVDGRSRLEHLDVLLLDVEAEEAIQPVGPAETPDYEPFGLSRGTRRQR